MQEEFDEFIVEMTYKSVDDSPYPPQKIKYQTSSWLKMEDRVKAKPGSAIVTDVLKRSE